MFVVSQTGDGEYRKRARALRDSLVLLLHVEKNLAISHLDKSVTHPVQVSNSSPNKPLKGLHGQVDLLLNPALDQPGYQSH